MAADDREDPFHDAFGAGQGGGPDRWPANETGPAGEVAKPKTGKSGVVKVLLILFAVGVVAAVLCCGGGYWWFSQNFKVVTTPAEVAALTQEMVPIEILEGFNPQMGMKMNMFGVKVDMAMYQGPGQSLLQIMRFGGQAFNDPQARQQIDAQMRQQQGGGSPHIITVKDVETKTVSIDGADVEFTVGTGPESQSGAEWKELNGSVNRDGSVVVIKLQQPSDQYDDEAVTAMLESIGKK